MTDSKKPILGIILIVTFCFLATITDGVVRYITIGGLPSSQILFLRCFFGTLILLPVVLKNKSLFVSKKTFKLYLARGILAFLGMSIWFYILQHADFTALVATGFTLPLFTALLAICFLGEKSSKIKIAALLIGFSGAVIVVEPFSINFNIYLLVGVVASFLLALSFIFTKKLSADQSPVTAAFFFAAIITPLAFLIALPFWQHPTKTEWFYIVLLVATSNLGQIALAQAFSHADLTTLMPFGYSGLIFATIFSYIVFGDLITFNTLIGAGVILGSGYIIIKSERKKKHRAEELGIIP
jgi:drug/metabolite transporter (DMT)-like permease